MKKGALISAEGVLKFAWSWGGSSPCPHPDPGLVEPGDVVIEDTRTPLVVWDKIHRVQHNDVVRVDCHHRPDGELEIYGFVIFNHGDGGLLDKSKPFAARRQDFRAPVVRQKG